MTDANTVLKYLKCSAEVTVLEETDSTNSEMKRRLQREDLQLPSILLARRQTAGRGRMGKSFFSPDGGGMYLSVAVVPPDFQQVSLITVAAAVAVSSAIESLTGIKADVKWVNDLYLDGKKICGILAETVITADGKIKAVVVGIGVNLRSDFPDDLKDKAGAIDCDVNRLAALVADNLIDLTSSSDTAFIREYNRRLNIMGKEIIFIDNNAERHGIALGVREEGCLEVQASSGESVFLYGSDSIVKQR